LSNDRGSLECPHENIYMVRMSKAGQNYPSQTKVDVVVVGAGVSGVPAAVAAARAGAKTLLLEQRPSAGGTLSAGLGFPVCGLFENDVSKNPRLLNDGLSAELFSVISREVADPVFAMGQVYVCRCPIALFESIYADWLDVENLTPRFGVRNISVEIQDQRIHALSFQTLEGATQTCEVGQVVDCTGSGVIIQQSGAKQIVPEALPLAGFSVCLKGVENEEMLPLKVPYILRKAADAGELPAYCSFTHFSPLEDGDSLCKFSLPAETSRAEAEQTARRAIARLRKQIPAFHSVEVVQFSPSILQREGIRLKGQSILTGDDVRNGRSFEDGIARGGWPIEYWDTEKGIQYEYIENGLSYDIPLGALRSENIKNLWAAGRLLSADSAALASARVMGTAIATGEAAGRAAAMECL